MDTDILASDIRSYDLPDIYKLYLCSVAISQDYRGSVAFKMLYEAFFNRLLHLAQQDVYISEIVADAVTEEGKKLCEFLGMKQVKVSNHDSSIYKVSLLPPSIRVTTDKAKIFQTLYQKKYEEFKDLLDINQHL
ncbi:hypothetical protein [Paenibacillus sp. N3.4]|uniref:hypothetical protein n=1 Tax=Paenibacillus sp. N3.4 TaxID=2603222 RepID=UPI0011CAECE4|nr:hypothetical protein [Paenibacillus sp. N3.4]TXK82584.1 hypothetical protein FU659_14715 [Paenibacillus sp. N3.4]